MNDTDNMRMESGHARYAVEMTTMLQVENEQVRQFRNTPDDAVFLPGCRPLMRGVMLPGTECG